MICFGVEISLEDLGSFKQGKRSSANDCCKGKRGSRSHDFPFCKHCGEFLHEYQVDLTPLGEALHILTDKPINHPICSYSEKLSIIYRNYDGGQYYNNEWNKSIGYKQKREHAKTILYVKINLDRFSFTVEEMNELFNKFAQHLEGIDPILKSKKIRLYNWR